MKIVVDTNIIFSALLNTNGKISDLLLNSEPNLTFYAPNFIVEELERHHQKLLNLSKINESDLLFLRTQVLAKVSLVDLIILSEKTWEKALDLVHGIDEFDAPFVALSLHLNTYLWTGDKKLKLGLASGKQDWVLDTNQVLGIRESMG